jgi:predicted dehydrogenase
MPDLDAVTIATPNHLHSLLAVWACQAGKDVYVEKPVSHNIWEGRQLVSAAAKYNRVVQTGTQIRSGAGLQEAVAVANRLPQITDATVYAVDANSYFARPGPRVVEGIELLAHLFHPELFAWPHQHQPWAMTRGVAAADRYSGQQQ